MLFDITDYIIVRVVMFFFFQAEDGIRDLVRSRGLGDVYKRQGQVVLLVPLGMWFGCVLWLRSLCRYELPQRYRVAGPAGVTR